MSKQKERLAEVIELPDEDAPTVTLKHPIMVGGESVDTLTLRDPELQQLKGIKLPTGGRDFDLGELVPMVAVVANILPSEAGQIRASDLIGMLEEIAGFLDVSTESLGLKKK